MSFRVLLACGLTYILISVVFSKSHSSLAAKRNKASKRRIDLANNALADTRKIIQKSETLAQESIPENFIEGDIHISDYIKTIIDYNNASDTATQGFQKWPNVGSDVLVDYFLPEAYVAKNNVKEAMDEISKAAPCITFLPKTADATKFVSFKEDVPSGCWSELGYKDREQTINLSGAGCNHKGAALHQLMHTLGFMHEHTIPNRDQHITIEQTNIAEKYKKNFNTYSHPIASQNEDYDYASIMHFGPSMFAETEGAHTITPYWSIVIGQRETLSGKDIKMLKAAYCSNSDGGTDSTDGKTDGTDGKTDGTDRKTDSTDGKTDGTDGKTDGTDDKTDGTDGTDGKTDGTDGTGGKTDGTDGKTDGGDGTDGSEGTDDKDALPSYGDNVDASGTKNPTTMKENHEIHLSETKGGELDTSIMEGDMKCSEELKKWIVEGRALSSTKRTSDDGKTKLAGQMKWPSSTGTDTATTQIFANIPETLDDATKTAINEAKDELAERTCIRIVPKTDTTQNYVTFSSNEEQGCWSNVGHVGGEQTINLGGAGCKYKGAVLHQIMHTLGFLHEHTKTNRENNIEIIAANIKDGKRGIFKSYHHILPAEILPYDHYSIMHFDEHAYAVSDDKSTITSKVSTIDSKMLGQRTGLSKQDIAKIKSVYCPSEEKEKEETEEETDETTDETNKTNCTSVNCNCQQGQCADCQGQCVDCQQQTQYPCWPQDYQWSSQGYPQSCACHDKHCKRCNCVNFKSKSTSKFWNNNHLCFNKRQMNPKFQLLRKGSVAGKRCLLIDESKPWSNLHLCYDKTAPYKLSWSDVDVKGKNGKSRCLKIREPKDLSWSKKFLCSMHK